MSKVKKSVNSLFFNYVPFGYKNKIYVEFFKNIPKKISSPYFFKKTSALLIIDENLGLNKERLVVNLLNKIFQQIIILKINTNKKDIKGVEKIWKMTVEKHPDLLISLGGGTTSDMVAFASSTYHRGIDHIFFPTTLLAMIDATIGGKTGIDYGNIKNSIGSIHYAKHVFSITNFLKTLSVEEQISGLAEAIKIAVLFDKKYFLTLERIFRDKKLVDLNKNELVKILIKSAKLKARLCEQPMSQRSKLLYGHNVGHAIERYNRKHLRHGDCVSIGINIELALAVILGIFDPLDWKRQKKLIMNIGLPYSLPSYINLKRLQEKMQLYKLFAKDEYLFVLPKEIGKIYTNESSYFTKIQKKDFPQLIRKVMEFIQNN